MLQSVDGMIPKSQLRLFAFTLQEHNVYIYGNNHIIHLNLIILTTHESLCACMYALCMKTGAATNSKLEQLARTEAKSLISTFLTKNDAQHKDKLEYLDMGGDEAQSKIRAKQNQEQQKGEDDEKQ